jgi:hypothetical protein
MRAWIWFMSAVLAAWCPGGAVLALGDDPQGVTVTNTTRIPVTLRADYWIDGDMTVLNRPAPTWLLKPGETRQVVPASRAYQITKFSYTLENADGVSPGWGDRTWIAQPDQSGAVNVKITYAELPSSHGSLLVHNTLDKPVTIAPVAWTTADGATRRGTDLGDWTVGPGRRGLLVRSNGREDSVLKLVEVTYRLSIAGKQSLCRTRYFGGGFLSINLTPELLERLAKAGADEIVDVDSPASGQLTVVNTSGSPLEIAIESYTDAVGNTIGGNSEAFIAFKAGESAGLTGKNGPIEARLVNFSIRTPDGGVSNGNARFKGGLQTLVAIDQATLKAHQTRVAEQRAREARAKAARDQAQRDAEERAQRERAAQAERARRERARQDQVGKGLAALGALIIGAIVVDAVLSNGSGGGGGGGRRGNGDRHAEPCANCRGEGREAYWPDVQVKDGDGNWRWVRGDMSWRECIACGGSGIQR